MKVIGVAGEAGCGKSAVCGALAAREGIEWVDLDRLAWDVYRPDTPTYERLVSRFGSGILARNGEVDRSRLADIVFSDREALADLNGIVHPALNEKLLAIIGENRSRGTGILLVEGALLGVSPHVDYSLFDAIVWLAAGRHTRARRLRSAGRAGHLKRGLQRNKAAETIEIDAEGTVERTAGLVLDAIESLPEKR